MYLIQYFLLFFVTSASVDVSPPAREGAFAPGLFRDDAGVVLVWAEPGHTTQEVNVGSSSEIWAIRGARFENNVWSEPFTVKQATRESLFLNWADVPAVARNKEKQIIVTWLPMVGQGTYAYHIFAASSKDDGKTWQLLGPIHDDHSLTEHGFVSLVAQSNDRVRGFWLDGREMAHSKATDHAGEHDHGAGDMTLRTALLPEQGQGSSESILLDERVCECCGTDAVSTPAGSVVVYRDRSQGEIRDICFVYQDEKTQSGWSQPAPVHVDGWEIAACPVNGPAIDAAADDLVVAWYSGAEHRPGVHISFGTTSSFKEPISVDTGSLGRVDVVMLDGGDEAIVSSIVQVIGSGQLQLHRVGVDGAVGKPYHVAQVDGGRPSGFPKICRLGDEELFVVWTKPAKKKGGPLGLGAARIPLADIPPVSSGQS